MAGKVRLKQLDGGAIAGHLITSSTGVVTSLRHNLSASTNPSGADDSTAGYGVGSVWANTTDDRYYVCLDASATNAIWLRLGIPVSSTAPSNPVDGDYWHYTTNDMLMFYDGGRSKWLSVERIPVAFSDNGNNAPGAYYQWGGNLRMSATRGLRATYNGTIVGIEYTRDDLSNATFEVVKGGAAFSPVAELVSAATSGGTDSLDSDFDAGDILAIRNKTGGTNVNDGSGVFYFRWRV